MDLGYHQWTSVKTSDMKEDIFYAKKYGYNAIELLIQKVDKYLKTHSIEELSLLIREYSLRPAALSGVVFFNLKTPDEFEGVKKEFVRQCEIAKGVNCPVVIVVASPNPDNISKERIKEDAVLCLRQLSEIANGYDIKIACEFLGFAHFSINQFIQCYEIIKDADRDNVGIVVDCFHFYANGSSLEDLRRADRKKILAVHIDDCIDLPLGTYRDDSARVYPGDGVIPLGDILRTLRYIGFDGAAVLELFNEEVWTWEPEKIIRIGKEKMEKVIKASLG